MNTPFLTLAEYIIYISENYGKNYPVILDKIIKYSKFIKLPLEISMFVPCDSDGNILQPPTEYQRYLNMMGNPEMRNYGLTEEELNAGIGMKCLEYQKAKENCLFEGIELNQATSYLKGNNTIEGLTNLPEKLKPLLNQNAFNKLEL
jgi:hypothetical protein